MISRDRDLLLCRRLREAAVMHERHRAHASNGQPDARRPFGHTRPLPLTSIAADLISSTGSGPAARRANTRRLVAGDHRPGKKDPAEAGLRASSEGAVRAPDCQDAAAPSSIPQKTSNGLSATGERKARHQIDPCHWVSGRSTSLRGAEPQPGLRVCFARVSHRLPQQGDDNRRQPTAPDGAGLTILVIEDEFWIRLWVADFLRGCGHRVVEAPTGDDTIELLASGNIPFDVVFSDIEMPGDQWLRAGAVGSHPSA